MIFRGQDLELIKMHAVWARGVIKVDFQESSLGDCVGRRWFHWLDTRDGFEMRMMGSVREILSPRCLVGNCIFQLIFVTQLMCTRS